MFDTYSKNGISNWGDDEKVLWPEGEPVMIAGSQGLGKSAIAQQLMLRRIGVHHPSLLGYSVRCLRKGEKALYLAMDRPRQIQRSMARMVDTKDRKKLDDKLLVHRGPLLEIDILNEPESLADWIEQHCEGTRDVYVDSIKDLAPRLNDDDVGLALNTAFQEVIARGMQLFTAHHGRKGQGAKRRAITLDDVYGSTFITACMGSVLGLDGTAGDDLIQLRHLKQPSDSVGPLDVVHNRASGSSKVPNAEDELLKLLAKEKEVTLPEAATALYGAKTKRAENRVRRQVKTLARDGIVELEAGKHGGREGGGRPAVIRLK